MKLQDMIEVWNKIDYHEEKKIVDESCSDDDDAKAANLSGEDNMMEKLSPGADTQTNNFFNLEEGDITSEQATGLASRFSNENDSQLAQGFPESNMEEQESGCSDDWMANADDPNPWVDENGSFFEAREVSEGQGMGKDLQLPGQSGPHVKTSATLGVGLRELLELIDENLKVQDEKQKTHNVLERSIFERKWRPSKL